LACFLKTQEEWRPWLSIEGFLSIQYQESDCVKRIGDRFLEFIGKNPLEEHEMGALVKESTTWFSAIQFVKRSLRAWENQCNKEERPWAYGNTRQTPAMAQSIFFSENSSTFLIALSVSNMKEVGELILLLENWEEILRKHPFLQGVVLRSIEAGALGKFLPDILLFLIVEDSYKEIKLSSGDYQHSRLKDRFEKAFCKAIERERSSEMHLLLYHFGSLANEANIQRLSLDKKLPTSMHAQFQTKFLGPRGWFTW
jgi:hypothetical protein